jgi:hypothetical protein
MPRFLNTRPARLWSSGGTPRQRGKASPPLSSQRQVLGPQRVSGGPGAVKTEKDRPALAIRLIYSNGIYELMAIHAPSVSYTFKPQAAAISSALTAWSFSPHVIFGDFNVNARNSTSRAAFINAIRSDWTEKYSAVCSGRSTHQKGSELDWALKAASFGGTVKVSVVNCGAAKTLAQIGGSKDDGDYMPTDSWSKKSDHEAILIEIS